jgi:hypothetical protein
VPRRRPLALVLALAGCELFWGADTSLADPLLCKSGVAMPATERAAAPTLLFTTDELDARIGPMIAAGGVVSAVIQDPDDVDPPRLVRWTDAAPLPEAVADLPPFYRITTLTPGADALYLQAIDGDRRDVFEVPDAVMIVRAGAVETLAVDLWGGVPLLLRGDGALAQQNWRGEFVQLSFTDGSTHRVAPGALRAALGERDTLFLYRLIEDVEEGGGTLIEHYFHRIDRVDLPGGTPIAVSQPLCIDADEDGEWYGVEPAFALGPDGPLFVTSDAVAGLDADGGRRVLARIPDHALYGLGVADDGIYFFGRHSEHIALLRVAHAGGRAEQLATWDGDAEHLSVSGWALTDAAVHVALARPDLPGELWRVAR